MKRIIGSIILAAIFIFSSSVNGKPEADRHRIDGQAASKHKHHKRYFNDSWRWRYPSWRYGWNNHWNGNWASYFWLRPYSGIGISIPLSSGNSYREIRQPKIIRPPERITTSVEFAHGLKTLPDNARFKQIGGKTVYEWQGKHYVYDWLSHEYKVIEVKSKSVSR